MAFTAPKEIYNGKINSITIGKGETAIEIGGAEVFPQYSFDGNAGKPVAVALEINDIAPTDWAEALNNVYGSVYDNPVEWALYCQNELEAQALCLRLQGTHPDQQNRSPEEAAKTVREVLEAIKVPLIIVGANHIEKDAEVIKVCAEAAAGYHCLVGKAQEKNHKTIAAAAMAYDHVLLALSNLDINLAKLGLVRDPRRLLLSSKRRWYSRSIRSGSLNNERTSSHTAASRRSVRTCLLSQIR
ncbi:MAG: hypothetical protein ACE5GM_08110, partial [bacterium]